MKLHWNFAKTINNYEILQPTATKRSPTIYEVAFIFINEFLFIASMKVKGTLIVRILKKRAREMSHSKKVSRTFEFLRVFGAAEKIQAKV